MTKSLRGQNWEGKTLIILVISGILFTTFPIFESKNKKAEADSAQFSFEEISENLTIIQENSLLPIADFLNTNSQIRKIKVVVTAYSSSIQETDENPYITAAGTWVRDGIVANNKYPFGTKIRFPEIYGDKIFIVEDRMHWRKGLYQFDVWMDSYKEAKRFGAKIVEAEILEI